MIILHLFYNKWDKIFPKKKNIKTNTITFKLMVFNLSEDNYHLLPNKFSYLEVLYLVCTNMVVFYLSNIVLQSFLYFLHYFYHVDVQCLLHYVWLSFMGFPFKV